MIRTQKKLYKPLAKSANLSLKKLPKTEFPLKPDLINIYEEYYLNTYELIKDGGFSKIFKGLNMKTKEVLAVKKVVSTFKIRNQLTQNICNQKTNIIYIKIQKAEVVFKTIKLNQQAFLKFTGMVK